MFMASNGHYIIQRSGSLSTQFKCSKLSSKVSTIVVKNVFYVFLFSYKNMFLMFFLNSFLTFTILTSPKEPQDNAFIS